MTLRNRATGMSKNLVGTYCHVIRGGQSPQILADQLTLFQPGFQIFPRHIVTAIRAACLVRGGTVLSVT